MLISALCDYYDMLSKKGLVLPEAYSTVDVQYIISLSEEGKIDSIIDCQQSETYTAKNKIKERKVPQKMIFPKITEKPGIEANIIEHRPAYIFGLNCDSKATILTASDKTNKAMKSHESFVKKNLDFLEGINTPLVNAYRNFINKWIPENETQNELLLGIGKFLTTGKFAFCLAGHPEKLLHDDPEVKRKWEQWYTHFSKSEDMIYGQCCITGNNLPIESIHAKIKRLPGGFAMGNTMISFNSQSEESYGKKQSLNSCISKEAAEKYTKALNYLLADKRHRTLIDETTYIYWAASDNEDCNDLFSALTFNEKMDSEHTNEWLRCVFDGIKRGMGTQEIIDGIENVDSGVNFYVVGIKPNSARLALKFIYRQSFGVILQNTIQHYLDMQLETSNGKPVSISKICGELVSPKSSNDKVSPALVAKLFDSIVKGSAYPVDLLAMVIRRVKTDADEENKNFIKMNDVRMGLIKACINRDARLRGKQEEIKMSLDVENRDPAYLCGRLFCKLEEIQKKASGDAINRAIRDSYFSSAATRPSIVFPRLLSLSQHHLAKLDNKSAYYMDKEVSQIIGMMGNEFPSNLSLKEQGIFMLGYYQQKNSRFEK